MRCLIVSRARPLLTRCALNLAAAAAGAAEDSAAYRPAVVEKLATRTRGLD